MIPKEGAIMLPAPLLILSLVLAAGYAHQARDTAGNPRDVVLQATRAVEGDSAVRLRRGWEARVKRDSTDRAATLWLATVARLTYDYPASERLYSRLYANDSTTPNLYAAYARLGFAQGLEARSYSKNAREQFTRARELAHAMGDRLCEAEALIWLSFIRGRLEGVSVAAAHLDTAERLLPASELSLLSQLRHRRAIVYALRGMPQSVAEADSSIALAQRAGDIHSEADGFRVLGQVLLHQGRFDSSIVAFRRGDELYRRARDPSTLASFLIFQAQALAGLGKFGEWREVMRVALTEGEASNNPGTVAVAYRSSGVMGILMGDFAAAADYLKKSAAISEETGDNSGVITTRKFLASVALATGDVGEARRHALDVLEISKKAEEPRPQLEMHRTLIGIAILERDWETARRSLAECRALLKMLPGAYYEQWTVHDEGRVALASGDLEAAERSFVAFLRNVDTLSAGADIVIYDTRLRLADIYARRGELARAEREIVAASDQIDHWRARLNDAELRVLAFQASASQYAAVSEVAERDARVARVLSALAAGGRAALAFELAERRRARELMERIARASALRVEAAGQRQDSARRTRRSTRITASELAGLLPDDRTALLEFVGGVSGAPTTVFVAQRSGVSAHTVPSTDSLSERVSRLVALMVDGSAPSTLARSLGAALLDSALAELGPSVTRLIIVPDGALHRVPWDALRIADGRYAVERYAVSVAPSAAVVTELWRRAESGTSSAQPIRALVFGDPTFAGERGARSDPVEQSAAAEVYRSAFDSAGGLPRLKASAKEARLVARYTPGAEVRLREDASAAFLKRTPLDSFGILHFATHALVDDRSVARTALALAPGDGESGFIGAGDLAALRLEADLVVLSACRTAGGVVIGGEGVQGLTAPLLQAGARSVVATQWRIGDRSTVAFVDAFYGALAGGLPMSEALRSAKLDAIGRGAPPAEWAAFTAVGDPLVTLPLKAPTPSTAFGRWWIAAIGILALVIVVVLRKKQGIRNKE